MITLRDSILIWMIDNGHSKGIDKAIKLMPTILYRFKKGQSLPEILEILGID